MAQKLRRDAGQAWIERTNPLRGLSIREAQMIFDAARVGDTQRLHWIFQEIEAANPTLMTCVERRTSALAMLPWSATVRASADETLADEQKDAIERLIGGIDNFDEAVEHLNLAFFRGFAYAQPLIEPDGTVRHVELIPSWTFLSKDGRLYYNPACDGFSSTAEEVTAEAGLVGIRRTRAVDYPALAVHIREAVGERDWGRFLERIALPKPAVTMAPAATEDDKALYVEAAERVEDGLVSVWPNGAALTDFMGGSRGQDPFSAFVRHQEERIVRLATGGTLGSIAEAGSGTLAGGAQADVWREIVGRDAVIVGAAIMRSLVRPYLERAFPGRPIAAEFAFDAEKRLTAKECAEVAATLYTAGWRVDRAELEEATGFTLEREEAAPAPGGFALAKARKNLPEHAGQTMGAGQRSPGTGQGGTSEDVLKAFAQDTGPAADAIRDFLDDPSQEAAEDLLRRLPDLIEDRALAAVIAEEMARAMAEGLTETARATERVPGGNGNGGQFTGRTNQPRPREHADKGRQDAFGTADAEALTKSPERNIERGKAVVTHLLGKKQGAVDKAMYRKDVGWIGVDYGKPGNAENGYKGGHGLSHIVAKHPGAVDGVVDVLQHGEAYKHDKERSKVFIIKDRTAVVLSKNRDGRLLITSFEKLSENQLSDYTSRGKYHAKGEN